MADTDLIACLYPFQDVRGDALKAMEDEANESRYIPPRSSRSNVRHGRRDRASTEEPEQCEGNSLEYRPRLELRFSHGPQTSYGFVFGRHQNCDVVLSDVPGISSHHFALTFDEHNRLIVKDLGSLYGTQVIYDNHGKGRRRDFRWIVGGHKVPERKGRIVIKITELLKFRIVVSHHNITSQVYIDNVNWFRQGIADAENLFGRLNFPLETERVTGTHTPGTGPIFLKKRLGEGGFGVVTHIWNVSTAEEYALKKPSVKAIREKEVDVDEWEKEARIMGRIKHVS